jgi:hypothetical protein
MKNKTQRRIHKYFFLIIFVSYFSAKITSEGMRQPTTQQMREKKKSSRKSQGSRKVTIPQENVCSNEDQNNENDENSNSEGNVYFLEPKTIIVDLTAKF